jgi:hypothetical protein
MRGIPPRAIGLIAGGQAGCADAEDSAGSWTPRLADRTCAIPIRGVGCSGTFTRSCGSSTLLCYHGVARRGYRLPWGGGSFKGRSGKREARRKLRYHGRVSNPCTRRKLCLAPPD